MPIDNILITGGAGFIGNHLARSLLNDGKKVSIIDDLSTGLYSNIKDLENHPNFSLYVSSVKNEQLIERLMRENKSVYHLASAVGVKLIMERPIYTIDNIYQSTETILRFAKIYRNKVLITSTSEVYGKSKDIPYTEDGDRVEGPTDKHRWAYACAKALDEFLALAYWKETNLPVVIVRLFNTVGPTQRGQYGMVFPKFVKWAITNEPIQIYGDGNQSRCFCHVLDVVKGLRMLLESDHCFGQVYNIGSTEEISINSLAEKIIKTVNSTSKVIHIPYEKIYGEGFEDMNRRVPSIDKINKAVGWVPVRTINDIIKDIADNIRP